MWAGYLGLGQNEGAGCFEHRNAHLCCIKCGEFLDKLRKNCLLSNFSAVLSEMMNE